MLRQLSESTQTNVLLCGTQPFAMYFLTVVDFVDFVDFVDKLDIELNLTQFHAPVVVGTSFQERLMGVKERSSPGRSPGLS